MCGILGFNWNDPKLAVTLCSSLKHRGPDQNGTFHDSQVTLGHTRLSILDLSERGKQPMSTPDKNLMIVFNGEIFNYQELRSEFPADTFLSTSDTEVILNAYKKYGVSCVDKLDGQFAFCIYDVHKKILFLARDRAGINPLYYYDCEEKFIFGSELKIILSSGVPKQINTYAFRHYLAYGFTPRSQSIIDHAYKLEPGHYLIYDLKSKTAVKTKYWDVASSAKITDEAEAIQLIRSHIDRAVKSRLVADVPVGAFLSGGLDSSAVVAYASKYKQDLNTFSVSFDDPAFDEQKYSSAVACHFKTNHHVLSFGADDVKKLLPQLAYHYDEPFADPSMVPTFFVSKVARKHVTVSLSGDGGDELF
ncbi:MAG TPA: asparagine synthase (glutamine-hydrolyzing), partial [Candidatus Nanoarchaeia archaeon]|nr:asparagine synthase (glutamine-hydrolyzing) [Candidatus Nanoarchaeia archaeon]